MSRTTALVVARDPNDADTARIVADVPKRIHRQVRIKCIARGELVRDYILELLAKDGIR